MENNSCKASYVQTHFTFILRTAKKVESYTHTHFFLLAVWLWTRDLPLEILAPQSVTLGGLAVQALPGSLLEMQNLWPYSRPTESETAFDDPQVTHRHIEFWEAQL